MNNVWGLERVERLKRFKMRSSRGAFHTMKHYLIESCPSVEIPVARVGGGRGELDTVVLVLFVAILCTLLHCVSSTDLFPRACFIRCN